MTIILSDCKTLSGYVTDFGIDSEGGMVFTLKIEYCPLCGTRNDDVEPEIIEKSLIAAVESGAGVMAKRVVSSIVLQKLARVEHTHTVRLSDKCEFKLFYDVDDSE